MMNSEKRTDETSAHKNRELKLSRKQAKRLLPQVLNLYDDSMNHLQYSLSQSMSQNDIHNDSMTSGKMNFSGFVKKQSYN